MQSNPTVYVVDDDPAFRKSMQWLIESVGLKVQAYESAREFLAGYEPDSPGCIVLDVRMPGMSGLDLQEYLDSHDINIPIIMVTAHGDVPMAVRAMRSGAIHFLQKPFSDQVVLDHIQNAIAQDIKNHRKRSDHLAILKRVERLTKREQQVMKLVVDGLSSKQIADELGISFKTIEAHRAKIMKKMEATSVPHLIHMNIQSIAIA